jgi:anti-sigma B factor antagonist
LGSAAKEQPVTLYPGDHRRYAEVRTVSESAGAPVRETLTVATHREPSGLTTVQVDGEVDMLTAPTLLTVVGDELDSGCLRLLLDLRPVRFLGSCGLTALIAIASRCADSKVRLCLIADDPRVTRPLEMTGLATAFQIVSDPLEAW